MVTEPIDGVPPDLPTLRDPDRLTYYKEEVGGLVMGGYEPNPIPWAQDGIPRGSTTRCSIRNFDHFEPMMELALGRVPALETAGIKQTAQWPGELHARWQFHPWRSARIQEFLRRRRVQRLWHRRGRRRRDGAGGMGGQGRAALRPVAGRYPPLRPAAFRHRLGADPDLEAYGKHYTMAWPARNTTAGGPAGKSPLYENLKAQAALFR